MKKTLITEFFTTVSFRQSVSSFLFLTIKLPFIRKSVFSKYKNEKILEEKLLDYLNLEDSNISLFYNWRTAIYQLLKALDIKEWDEVIVNSYNCISVINSLIQSKATPIYIEVDKNNLSFNINDLENKITKNTKLIIIQHSFWKTWPIEETIELAKKYNIPVLEDCAHSLWSIYKWKKHWTFWDFALFSTWRDKVISSVNWWILLINNSKYLWKIQEVKDKMILPNRFLVIKNLKYNIIWYLSYKTYDFFSLWKVIMFLSRKFKAIPEVVNPDEKNCQNKNLKYLMPNSLIRLAWQELTYIDTYIEHRKKIAQIYNQELKFNLFKKAFNENSNEELNYFRYPVIFESEEIAQKFYSYMRKNNILLWNSWSWKNIVPKWTIMESTKYKFDCPNSESIASRILLLPNSKNITKKDVMRIINLSNNFES